MCYVLEQEALLPVALLYLDVIIGSCFFFFFYVRAYLGINSMKLITNGKDHIVTADKYTPR